MEKFVWKSRNLTGNRDIRFKVVEKGLEIQKIDSLLDNLIHTRYVRNIIEFDLSISEKSGLIREYYYKFERRTREKNRDFMRNLIKWNKSWKNRKKNNRRRSKEIRRRPKDIGKKTKKKGKTNQKRSEKLKNRW